MSIFDGMAGVLNATLGAPAVLSGSFTGTIQAVFREVPSEEMVGDGRPYVVVTPILRVLKSDAALIKGDVVAPSETPGRTFTVLQSLPSGSPAADAFVTYSLEEVQP